MPSNHTKSRGLILPSFSPMLSRSLCLESPLWLCLYRIDALICNSGFFQRRRLLRLRNDLLTALDIPSGNAWFVRVVKHSNQNKKHKDTSWTKTNH